MKFNARMRQLSLSAVPIVKKYKYSTIIEIPKKYIEKKSKPEKRGAINTFSKASARRFFKRYAQRPKNFDKFITISFPYKQMEVTGEIRRKFLKILSKHCSLKSEKSIYLWVAEENQAGVIHYHILNDIKDYKSFIEKAQRLAVEYGADIQKMNIHLKEKQTEKTLYCTPFANVKKVTDEKVMGYMGKMCTYMTKSVKYSDESFRRWGANFLGIPEQVQEISAEKMEIVDYYCSLSDKFFPRSIILDNDRQIIFYDEKNGTFEDCLLYVAEKLERLKINYYVDNLNGVVIEGAE